MKTKMYEVDSVSKDDRIILTDKDKNSATFYPEIFVIKIIRERDELARKMKMYDLAYTEEHG